MGKDSIFSEIDRQYNNLSKIFKLIADFVKDNYSTIPFLSLKELKEKIGVSTASITRFSQHMGFKGYPDFQKEIRSIVEKEIVPMREVKYFIENNDDRNILQETIGSNIKILQATYSDELYKNFNKTIEFITKSRKVYILGCRSSYSVAYYLGFMLQGFMDNIELIDAGHQDFSNKLAYIRNNDVLVAISFSQYTKFTSDIAQFFKDSGNRIIAITDSYSSPIAIKADTTLLAKNGPNTFSFVSAMTILNALIVSLGKINKKETLEKLKEQEKIAIDTGIYI